VGRGSGIPLIRPARPARRGRFTITSFTTPAAIRTTTGS
jgi:hypothetical protein